MTGGGGVHVYTNTHLDLNVLIFNDVLDVVDLRGKCELTTEGALHIDGCLIV